MPAGAILNLPRGSAERLSASTRRIRGAWASMGPELEQANQASIDWLNARALQHLDDAVLAHGRPQREDGRMRNVLINDLASTHSRRGFRWGVSAKLNRSPAGAYWRGIEHGTRVHVGRITRAVWITSGGRVRSPDAGRYPRDARMPTDWDGALDGRGWIVRIRSGITGYHFMASAADEFAQEGVYREQLRRASAQWRRVLSAARTSGVSPARIRRGG